MEAFRLLLVCEIVPLQERQLGASANVINFVLQRRFSGYILVTVYPPISGKKGGGSFYKGRILLSDILGRRRPLGFVTCRFCERILSHKGWNPVSDMSAPRPTPTAYRGVYCALLQWRLSSCGLGPRPLIFDRRIITSDK
jgi:hypothetical protein